MTFIIIMYISLHGRYAGMVLQFVMSFIFTVHPATLILVLLFYVCPPVYIVVDLLLFFLLFPLLWFSLLCRLIWPTCYTRVAVLFFTIFLSISVALVLYIYIFFFSCPSNSRHCGITYTIVVRNLYVAGKVVLVCKIFGTTDEGRLDTATDNHISEGITSPTFSLHWAGNNRGRMSLIRTLICRCEL